MADEKTTSVSAAFEILLEEMEAEIELANQVLGRAAEQSDYARVREMLERAEQFSGLRDRAAELRGEWVGAVTEYTEEEEQETGVSERRNLQRLQRGLRTRESAFFQPILQVLESKGGSANLNDVLDGVLPLVKDQLQDVDHEPLASDPDRPRWRNTAHWARWSMVQSGLLKDDSPRGIWEITEQGRQRLKQQQGS